MLEQAGLVGHGVRAGLNMHRARHTFATELRRVAGVEAASQALGHSDLSTTLGIYGHQDPRDLERAMEAFAAAREAEDVASRGERFARPARLNPAICRSDGGGGNRTRVRGRTGQSVYKRSLRFHLARAAGSQATYRRASPPLISPLRRVALLRGQPVV
jgi:hypothetical protein